MWVDIKANRLASYGKTEIVILLRRRDFTLPFCGDSQKHPTYPQALSRLFFSW